MREIFNFCGESTLRLEKRIGKSDILEIYIMQRNIYEEKYPEPVKFLLETPYTNIQFKVFLSYIT